MQEMITVLYTNAQSVQGKVGELAVVANDIKPDITLLAETWCNGTVDNAALTIPGYTLVKDLRQDGANTANSIGGGLLVYGGDGIEVLPNDHYRDNGFNQFYSFRLMTTKGNSLNFVLTYRLPSSRQENTIELCDLLRGFEHNTVLIGDINMPDTDWETGRVGTKGKSLLETIQEERLHQLISYPTHIKGNVLDLFITNCPHRVLSVEDVGRLGRSDHCVILMEMECAVKRKVNFQPSKNWSSANFEGMRRQIEKVNWARRLDNMCTEDAWNAFKVKLQ
jgi:hypothetical protein